MVYSMCRRWSIIGIIFGCLWCSLCSQPSNIYAVEPRQPKYRTIEGQKYRWDTRYKAYQPYRSPIDKEMIRRDKMTAKMTNQYIKSGKRPSSETNGSIKWWEW